MINAVLDTIILLGLTIWLMLGATLSTTNKKADLIGQRCCMIAISALVVRILITIWS